MREGKRGRVSERVKEEGREGWRGGGERKKIDDNAPYMYVTLL